MNIPAGPAAQTLKEFSRQAQVQIVFDARSVEGVATHPIHGRLSPTDALEKMLRGTPLVARHDKETGAYAIVRGKPLRSSSSQSGHPDLGLRVSAVDVLTKPKGDWFVRNL